MTGEDAAAVEADAARFRALMRCPWISMQGSAGVDPDTGARTGGNVHFGAEFWPHPPSPDFVAHYAKGTAWGRACLRALADAILEHEAEADGAGAASSDEACQVPGMNQNDGLYPPHPAGQVKP